MLQNGYAVVGMASDHWCPRKNSNGVVSYTANMVEGMRAAGARVYVVANQVREEAADEFVRPLPRWSESGTPLGRFMSRIGRRIAPGFTHGKVLSDCLVHAIETLHRREGIQVFEMEESFGVARFVAMSSAVPVIVRMHGPWFLLGPASGAARDRAYTRRIHHEGLAFARAAGLSAPSRDVIDRAEAFYDMPFPDARVIPNPVAPVPEDARWSPATCDANRLLFVGRFDRVKGADILLDAFARVLRHQPEAKLTMVGSDDGITEHDGCCLKAKDYMQRRFADPAVRRRIEWLGLRSASDILALRRASFLSVVASRYESFSMTALEAMASACPLVAPNVGGPAEIVQHERNGLLFRVGDPIDLADKILRLMNQPELAAHLGRQAVTCAMDRYHPVTVARQTLDYYRFVLEQAGRRTLKGSHNHAA